MFVEKEINNRQYDIRCLDIFYFLKFVNKIRMHSQSNNKAMFQNMSYVYSISSVAFNYILLAEIRDEKNMKSFKKTQTLCFHK